MQKIQVQTFLKESVYDDTIGHRIITKSFRPEAIRNWDEAENQYLMSIVDDKDMVCDFGCGHGRHLVMMSGIAHYLVGIDVSPSMYNFSCEQTRRLNNVSVKLADATNTDLVNNSFTLTMCNNNTYGNIYGYDQVKVLNEMIRITKPGGKVVIGVYSEHAALEQIQLYKNVGLTISNQDEDYVYTKEGFKSERFTKEKLKKMFEKVGYFDVDITPVTKIGYMAMIIR